jgi:hypothetical protein
VTLIVRFAGHFSFSVFFRFISYHMLFTVLVLVAYLQSEKVSNLKHLFYLYGTKVQTPVQRTNCIPLENVRASQPSVLDKSISKEVDADVVTVP